MPTIIRPHQDDPCSMLTVGQVAMMEYRIEILERLVIAMYDRSNILSENLVHDLRARLYENSLQYTNMGQERYGELIEQLKDMHVDQVMNNFRRMWDRKSKPHEKFEIKDNEQ